MPILPWPSARWRPSATPCVAWRVSPFSYRKVRADNPFLRELLIPFGAAGYVALFEIEEERTVTVLAVRHQLEDDYL